MAAIPAIEWKLSVHNRGACTDCNLFASSRRRNPLKALVGASRVRVRLLSSPRRRSANFPQELRISEKDVLRADNGLVTGHRAKGRSAMMASSTVFRSGVDPPKPTFVPLERITGEEHFDQILREAEEHKQPVIVDWLAAWCRKCIYLKPKLEKLAAEYHPDIKFYYVDVNTVPQSLVKRADVTKMPTIQLWRDGLMKAQVIGGHQVWLVLDEIREMIKDKS